MKLQNFIKGRWVKHQGDGFPQYNAVTGDLISTCGSEGLNDENAELKKENHDFKQTLLQMQSDINKIKNTAGLE